MHCMLVLPAGLRRVSEPNDDHLVVPRSRLRRLFSKVAVAVRLGSPFPSQCPQVATAPLQ